jgi:hypothetical protein
MSKLRERAKQIVDDVLAMTMSLLAKDVETTHAGYRRMLDLTTELLQEVTDEALRRNGDLRFGLLNLPRGSILLVRYHSGNGGAREAAMAIEAMLRRERPDLLVIPLSEAVDLNVGGQAGVAVLAAYEEIARQMERLGSENETRGFVLTATFYRSVAQTIRDLEARRRLASTIKAD